MRVPGACVSNRRWLPRRSGCTQRFDANGNPLVECAQFADGFVWGPVKLVDMQIAGEQAKSQLQPGLTCTQVCISYIRSILA
jgi:hypothetical protein